MPTPTNCYPSWYAPFATLAAQSWTKTIIPSGCVVNNQGNIPCAPSSMRASAEAWLTKNAPQVLPMIGGALSQDVYTFARYMHSEVGSGTVAERVAVGEAGVNQGKASGRTITKMLMPSGYYGPIHAPDAYCASIGKPPMCAPFSRWAATSRDPSIMSLLLAHLVVSGGSRNFANGAVTQWGPEAWIKDGQTRLTNFVKNIAATSKYYWVGPLPGIDPFHTFLVYKATLIEPLKSAAIQRGIAALTLPRKPFVAPELPVCRDGFFTSDYGLSGAEIALVALGSLAGLFGAMRFNRWLGHGEPM